MNRLHVNALVRDIKQAVQTDQRQNILNLNFFAAWYHALLTQFLEPCLVELVVYCVLGEDVVFEDQLIEVVLIRLTSLLVQHVNIPESIEKLSDIVELNVDSNMELLLSIDFFEILCLILRIMNYVRFGYGRVYWYLDDAVGEYAQR